MHNPKKPISKEKTEPSALTCFIPFPFIHPLFALTNSHFKDVETGAKRVALVGTVTQLEHSNTS